MVKNKYGLAVRTLKHKEFLNDAGVLVRWFPVELIDDNMAVRE